MRNLILAGMAIAAVSVPGLTGGLPGATAHEEEQRYSLEKTPEGYVRLDTRTGEMSICAEQSGELVCRMAADDRTAFEDELDRLKARLQDVEKRLAELEDGRPAPGAELPSEEDFEKTLGYMERFFRRFMDIIQDLEQDQPAPNRT